MVFQLLSESPRLGAVFMVHSKHFLAFFDPSTHPLCVHDISPYTKICYSDFLIFETTLLNGTNQIVP